MREVDDIPGLVVDESDDGAKALHNDTIISAIQALVLKSIT